jgi:nitrate reductase / nitrite oxidoreductase, alpha subunit
VQLTLGDEVLQSERGQASRSLLNRVRYLASGEVGADGRTVNRAARNDAEEFYRDRWRHDREVRSTHGVNCTGSCSWWVYVRDGIISWETQATDYPDTSPDMPAEEPRGCPRGASFSWYTTEAIQAQADEAERAWDDR